MFVPRRELKRKAQILVNNLRELYKNQGPQYTGLAHARILGRTELAGVFSNARLLIASLGQPTRRAATH